MCSSQAKRFFYIPEGDESIAWVKAANVMANRVVLLCHLAVALGHVFLLEQPSSAKFGDMPRWRHFCDNVYFASCRTPQILILGMVFFRCLSHFYIWEENEISIFGKKMIFFSSGIPTNDLDASLRRPVMETNMFVVQQLAR